MKSSLEKLVDKKNEIFFGVEKMVCSLCSQDIYSLSSDKETPHAV